MHRASFLAFMPAVVICIYVCNLENCEETEFDFFSSCQMAMLAIAFSCYAGQQLPLQHSSASDLVLLLRYRYIK